MTDLLIEFDGFPLEKSLIGEMLMAYGEIEFGIVRLLGTFLKTKSGKTFRPDHDTACRIVFRVRGEGARLEVADAMLRPALTKLSLGGLWGNFLGAARHCKDIRNQYAHCHWWFREGEPLAFMKFDADAASAEGPLTIQFEPIDLPLIQKQHQFFNMRRAFWIF